MTDEIKTRPDFFAGLENAARGAFPIALPARRKPRRWTFPKAPVKAAKAPKPGEYKFDDPIPF